MGERGSAVALVLLLLCRCGSEPAVDAGTDAAPDAAAPDASTTAPNIPWLADGEPPIERPRMTPCPAGWREVPAEVAGGGATCDPYPGSGAEACALGEAHFPGEPGCAPVGSSCPVGLWAEGLADDGTVLFVRAGATGGDGTRAAPFGSIQDAMRMATDGMTVALAKGSYAQRLAFRSPGVTLRGACSAETSLTTTGSAGTVIEVSHSRTAVRDLAILGGPGSAFVISEPGVGLDLEGIVIVDQAGFSLAAIADGARITVRSLFLRSPTAARDGIAVADGARVEVARAVIEAGVGSGINAQGTGTTLQLDDVVVRGARGGASSLVGGGITIRAGASASLSRVLAEDNESVGIGVYGGSELEASDTVVRDTSPHATRRELGIGLWADGSRVELRRLLVERTRTAGVLAEGSVPLRAEDIVIRHVSSAESDGLFGRGLQVNEGVSVEITRLHVQDCVDLGVSLGGGVHALSDVVVRDIGPRSADERAGSGVLFGVAAEAELTRVLVERTRDIALNASGVGARVSVSDLVLRDTLGQREDDQLGYGMEADRGAELIVRRALLERNRAVSAMAIGPGSTLRLEDTVIRDSLELACAETSCVGNGAGLGLSAVDMGTVSATRFRIFRSALCGVHVSRGGQMDLNDGEVAENPIAACVQTGGFDVSRLTNGVLFRDNERMVEAVDVTLPVVSEPGEI